MAGSGRIAIEGDTPPSTPQPQEQPEPQTPALPFPAPEPAPAQGAEPPAAAPATEPSHAELQQRIDRLTREKYEARRMAEEAAQRADAAERRQQQPTPPRPPPYGPPDTGADAEERAYQRYRSEGVQKEFDRACNDLYAKGREAFGESMDEAVRGLNAVGWGGRPDALAAVTRLPNGHAVYRELAQNLDNAARVLNLPPMDMAMELARMSVATKNGATASAPAVAPVSRAPEPLRAVGGNSGRPERPLSEVSMSEFIRRRDREEGASSRRIRR